MPEVIAGTEIAEVDLETLAAEVVALALKAGASDAEAVAREGDEFSVTVRLGQVETLQESGSRGLGMYWRSGNPSLATGAILFRPLKRAEGDSMLRPTVTPIC